MKLTGEWSAIVSKIGDRSVLVDLKHRFPLSEVDFEGDNGELIIYFISGSPGLFNGDRQDITCLLTEGAHLFLTNPSSTELHPSLFDEESYQSQTFHLEKDSILEYIPEPIIPFKGSNFYGKTALYMEEGSQAIIGDIITAGRVGRGEVFEYHCLTSRFEVYWKERLQVWDSFRLEPITSSKKDVFGPYTHMGTLWILSENITEHHLQEIQTHLKTELEEFECYGGASLLNENGLIIRLLGNSSQPLQEVMKIYWDYFRGQLLHLQPLEVLK